MLKVLLVDDEPYILKGLAALLDWEEEGFEIAGTASNGEEALAFLQENQVDLIIADIQMPVMTGLELLSKIKATRISDAYFVILTGYADFSYARQALRCDCIDYVLKPVEKEELLDVMEKVNKANKNAVQKKQADKKMEQAYLARNIISLIQGKYDDQNLTYVREHMNVSKQVRYIEIRVDDTKIGENYSDEEMRGFQRKLYQASIDFLKEESSHCVFDVSGQDKVYDIGFVYCDDLAIKEGLTEEMYLEKFHGYLTSSVMLPVIMLVGKKENDISQIARSYSTTGILRSFLGFRSKKDIYYYDREVQVNNGGILLCKDSLDNLIHAIEQNDVTAIRKGVDRFYEEMRQMEVLEETVNLNIHYLLFQLIHLAVSQDDKVNQEEIIRLISESSFSTGIQRGSKMHLESFAIEYASYLAQLRKNVSRGVLAEIDKEIREHFRENLTLKGFSEKYYVNSAYLGQLFRKKYGQSFKDYLNNYRIEQAATLLLRTDDKILEIAEKTGYHDLDYFVNRFIQVKGCTPSKFRKQAR